MQNRQQTSADDIMELLEIAQALARAETALLTSDANKAIGELRDLQQRAAILVARLEARASGGDVRAA
jgi:hypothetical protein